MAAGGLSSRAAAKFALAFDVRRFANARTLSAAIPWLVLILGLIAYHQVYTVYRLDTPVHGDGEGYYAYLVAYLLNHDPSFNTLITHHLMPAYAALGHQPPVYFGFTLQATGNWLDQYGIGTAVLLLPFFGIGHIISLAGGAKPNGYSVPEIYAVGTAAIVYTATGLLILRAVLRRWFAEWAVAVTLLAIVFGTSLFAFSTYDSVTSHAFSFFAVSLTLLFALRWYDRPTLWRAAATGLAAGLLIDIRVTNIVILAALPLLGVGSLAALRQRAHLLWGRRLDLIAVALCAVLVFIPQSITWHIATGHWIINSYAREAFDFLHPHLIESLFWFLPHGLLPYAPVLVFAFIGLGIAWVRRRDIALPVTVAFLPFWYLVAAWDNWSYASGFGHRGFIDILPLLAIPMAYLFSSLRGTVARAVAGTAALLLTGVTCALMLAYFQYRMSGSGIDVGGYLALLRHPSRLLGPPQIPSWLAPLLQHGR